ncbi:MAG TPA: phosphoribosylformylglycinamidine synthase subunit PurL [Candidatus Rubrimentiphilum sp.]|nr:phosphoribosylformylglycinamidine synthase subunit PurL [Candidatus Rubrimentiphilum sp.]
MRPDELRRIAEGLGREPTIVELHAFDAQWSEHCSYKSSRHLLKQLPTTGPDVVLGPGEDAGILHLGEHNGVRYGVVIAHESHNHPSQVVPFEGAATGVGGIVRDVLCMGAEVIGLADCLRFGRVEDPNSHQRYVAQQVVDGIAAYGNAIGVPNIAGDVYFDEGFNDNCLVNVIALGLVKESEIIHSRAPENSAGWDIVLVGKATDASGFGGASFSSLTLEEANQEANKSAVQVPDPFLKNVIMRASYRVFEYLREKKITAGFKDLGAGGIMGCTAELCAAGGYGAIIDLDDVNVAVENLPPEVIAVGETQERLCWILPGDATLDVLRIYNEEFSLPEIARGARAVVIGAVQSDKRYVMRHGSEIVMDVPIDFLTGAISEERPSACHGEPVEPSPSSAQRARDEGLRQLLSGLNACSREPLFKQYDAVVRGTTVIARGRADAGVIAPVPGAPFGVALSVGRSVSEAVRKVVAVGARPIGLTDCLNFGNPNNEEHYAQLVRAVSDLANDAKKFELPFVSGNVSLYNESSSGTAIPSSPIIGCVGVVDDLRNIVTLGFKHPESDLYFIATPGLAVVCEAMAKRLVLSASALGSDGLLNAAARMAFAADNDFGAEFGGAQAFVDQFDGWLIEVADPEAFAHLAATRIPSEAWRRVGTTTVADLEGEVDISVGESAHDLDELRAAWSKPLTEIYA